VDGTRSTHGRDKKSIQTFKQKFVWKRAKLKDTGVDGKKTLKLILKKYDMRIRITVMSRMMGIYCSNHEAENLLARAF
jgi:hypothetical protein